MKKIIRNMVFVSFLLMVVPALSGCFWLLAGAAAGASGYAWVKGEMTKEYQVTADRLYSAALKGAREMKLAIVEEKGDRISGQVKATFSDGKSADINIEAVTERSAKLRIRVGVFGDRARSEMIFKAIEKYI